MIKLQDGELRDYLPPTMKNDTDMVCLSYAIRRATERFLSYQKQTMVYNFIGILPGQICDILAVELRAPYYSDSMAVDTKRNIIKNTLKWHMKAGTPSAVNEMIEIVLGEGKVVEWPDFDGPPYTPGTFDIVSSALMTGPGISQLLSIIEKVKNKRSHLRQVLIKRCADQKIFAGTGQFTIYKPAVIIGGYGIQKVTGQKIFAGTGRFISYSPAAVTDGYKDQKNTGQEVFTGINQSLCYKPAAVTGGYQTTNIIKQKLYAKATGTAWYKPSAVMADAVN